MKIFAALILALAATVAAQARPLIIEESARISNPDPSFESFGGAVALDGDDAFAALWQPRYGDPEDEYDDEATLAVWLFRKVSGTWTPMRKLTEVRFYYGVWQWGMDAKNGVFALDPLVIFEKRNGDWVQGTFDRSNGAYEGPGDSVHVDGQRIFIGNSDGPFQGTLIEKSADGLWRRTATMYGEYRGGDDENHGRDVGLSADRAIVISPYSEEPRGYDTPNVSIFRNSGGGWQQEFVIANSGEAPLDQHATIHEGEIAVSSRVNSVDSFVYRPVNGGPNWTLADRLRQLGTYMGGGGSGIRITDDYLLQNSFDYDGDRTVINVFAKDASGTYANVARLVASDGGSLGGSAISGRRVIAACRMGVCVFELPASFAQPAVLQDTFSGTTPAGWSSSAGSQFAIAQGSASRVLRQSQTTSAATHTALLADSNWANQSIEADVRPTTFNGSDRWVGLATRYRDAGNHYYVTLRSSNVIRLRKLVDGAQLTLASATLPVTTNRSYRLRLESIGRHHRVYADGVLLLDAFDSTFASGRAGLLTYRAAADFDNVIVSPSPLTTVYHAPAGRSFDDRTWTVTGPGAWGDLWTGTELVTTQTSVAGDARALIGVPTDDQEVQLMVRPTAFASGGTGDKWFGAIARYQDDTNYYYLSVRSGGTVSLRKLVDGAIGVLATANMPLNLNDWYTLRLEAVGSRLRGYVNGTLVLEAMDTALPSGKSGMVTYRAAAQFKELRTIQP
jgi:hypothetical protein